MDGMLSRLMTTRFELLLRGAEVFTTAGLERCDVGVRAGKIAAIGDLSSASSIESWQLDGALILPGLIDSHVYFGEPGTTFAEDFGSGTAGAALGGLTGVFEMPSAEARTDSPERLMEKLQLSRGRTWVDHAFFVGATAENARRIHDLEKLEGCAGIKISMADTSGPLLITEQEILEKLLRNGSRRIVVHCEDEARLVERFRGGQAKENQVTSHPHWRDVESALRATERLLNLAQRCKRRVHILHISSAEEVELLARHRDIASFEVTPQHLTLTAPDAYERLGTLAQMNPPIREAHHQTQLWEAIRNGLADTVASAHSPYSLEKKSLPYPGSLSGMTGVQSTVGLMLDHVAKGRLSLTRLVDLMAYGPARLFNLAGKGRIALGYDADFTVVDLKASKSISPSEMVSAAGWTPFEGYELTGGYPIGTIVRGHIVMKEGQLQGKAPGAPLRFQESL